MAKRLISSLAGGLQKFCVALTFRAPRCLGIWTEAQAEALHWGGLPRLPDDAAEGKEKGNLKGVGKGKKGDPAPAVEG